MAKHCKKLAGVGGTVMAHWLRTSKLLEVGGVENGPVELWTQLWHMQEGQGRGHCHQDQPKLGKPSGYNKKTARKEGPTGHPGA